MLDRLMPDVRLINLETAITAERRFDPHKGIHYWMTPANLPALSAIRPHVCTLANNHVLDFGRRGLADTFDALRGRAFMAWAPVATSPTRGDRRW